MRISKQHHVMIASGGLSPNGKNKGVRRMWQLVKRRDAEARNAKTPHDRTKAHRLNRCGCK